MNKHIATKRLFSLCFCVGIGFLAPVLAGCGKGAGGGHQMTADDFKQKPMPSEAAKAMAQAQSHAGPPPAATAPPAAPK